MNWGGPPSSPAEYIAFDSGSELIPVGRDGVSAVQRRTSTFDLFRLRLIDAFLLRIVKALEKPSRDLRALVFRKLEGDRQELFGVVHDETSLVQESGETDIVRLLWDGTGGSRRGAGGPAAGAAALRNGACYDRRPPQMSERKSWGSTVMGWFVVADQPAAAEAEPQPAAEEPPLNVFASPPPAAPGGAVQFEQVFEAAKIDAAERERVTRTLDLLNSLPEGTEEAVRKQIVMASLRAFGVPIDAIIEAAAQEIQALEAYIRSGAADTDQVTSEAEQRIKQYEEEIVKLRTVMQQRVTEQQTVVKSCNDKKLEVQKVLEFFGQDAVARVVRDSPKLHEPAGKNEQHPSS